jgi:HNH endonuclease
MREIQLTQGQIALVNDEDFEEFSKFKWNTLVNGKRRYAQRNVRREDGTRTVVLMHRQILGVIDPKRDVDHRDRDGLNNQRENLRECSRAENLRNRGTTRNNTTGYKGVSSCGNGFRAQIRVDGKKIHLGTRPTPKAAYQLYCDAAHELHGEFANFGMTDITA